MQAGRTLPSLAGVVLFFLAGCSFLRNVSQEPPYPQYVGKCFALTCDCVLWDDGVICQRKRFITEPSQPTEKVVCELPKGTLLTLEKVQRRNQRMLISPWPWLWEDAGVVSFEHPKLKQRSLATIQLTNLGIGETANGGGNWPG
jgi:hypothetical protein